jgi:hypothetical protein
MVDAFVLRVIGPETKRLDGPSHLVDVDRFWIAFGQIGIDGLDGALITVGLGFGVLNATEEGLGPGAVVAEARRRDCRPFAAITILFRGAPMKFQKSQAMNWGTHRFALFIMGHH